jgi:hypothetical protein
MASASAASPAPPQVLLAHHLRQLKLPTFLREYEKLAAEAIWPIMISGAELATVGALWCSASQYRKYPSWSANCAMRRQSRCPARSFL